MDFARKQLEKYGWSHGKGLGKHENGISEPLKPKLKRSVAGIGHDAASDFTEHWWTTLYDKAASNVEVEDNNGKTKKIKTKDTAEFEITNSTWKLKRKKEAQEEEQYADYFVKKAILTNGGANVKKVKESDTEDEMETRDVTKMTDEELFAACGGRTAHKGARHGLKALGKLARIEQQEQMLLNLSRYDGYSHTKNQQQNIPASELQVVENLNLNSDSDAKITKRKKKKKKKYAVPTNCSDTERMDSIESVPRCIKKKKQKLVDEEENVVDTNEFEIEACQDITSKRKKKKKRKKMDD